MAVISTVLAILVPVVMTMMMMTMMTTMTTVVVVGGGVYSHIEGERVAFLARPASAWQEL
jgi:hypothetical protein